jgi:hypothetical protein
MKIPEGCNIGIKTNMPKLSDFKIGLHGLYETVVYLLSLLSEAEYA